MKQARTLEVADDQEQGNVVVPTAVLREMEKLAESLGLGEGTMPLIMHHFLIGGLSYLKSAPISKLRTQEVRAFVSKNKAAIRMLARSVQKTMPKEADESEEE